MKNKSGESVKSFKEAVEATPDVATGYKKGLTALGSYSVKVSVGETSLLQGSIDIDGCTKSIYPNDNRWDYAFAYDGEVFFIEVHSANSGEVKTVLKKLQWLKDWLNQKAPEINKLKARNKEHFYWVQSNGFAIPKNTPQYRAAIAAGLKPQPQLSLS